MRFARPALLACAVLCSLPGAAGAETNLVEPLSNGLKLSMVMGEIQNTFGAPTEPSWDSRTFGYREFSVQCGGSRAEIWRVRLKNTVKLSSGVGPGSSRADVKRVFGADAHVIHGQYELTFEYQGDVVDQIKIEPANGSFAAVSGAAPGTHHSEQPRGGRSSLAGKWFGNGTPMELLADGTYLLAGKPGGNWRVEGEAVMFDGSLAAWNGGRAQLKEGRIEFLWKDAKGFAYWFWYARQ